MEKVWIKSGRVKANNCPECGEVLDSFTGMSTDKDRVITPCEGDVTMCAKCGVALKFHNFGYAYATEQDYSDVEPKIRQALDRLGLRFQENTNART